MRKIRRISRAVFGHPDALIALPLAGIAAGLIGFALEVVAFGEPAGVSFGMLVGVGLGLVPFVWLAGRVLLLRAVYSEWD